ncbi:MAG: hypothetical protein ACJAUP_001823 [Cellvibrionaceae bacterium]|jgi:hypothetical protein
MASSRSFMDVCCRSKADVVIWSYNGLKTKWLDWQEKDMEWKETLRSVK